MAFYYDFRSTYAPLNVITCAHFLHFIFNLSLYTYGPLHKLSWMLMPWSSFIWMFIHDL
jgi:hypothetical protein